MKKLIPFIILTLTLLMVGTDATAQRRRSSSRKQQNTEQSVRKRQRDTKRAITETSKKISENQKEINRRLNTLNSLNSDIATLNTDIAGKKDAINRLNDRINQLNDSVTELDNRLSSMSAKYGSAVRRIATRNRNSTSNLAFIFSAKSVGEAYRRGRSLEQFSKWRKRKADEINKMKVELDEQRIGLEKLKDEQRNQLVSLNATMDALKAKRDQSDRIVASLKKEGKQLKNVLDQRKKEAESLEKELQRLIALEQQRRQEEERQAKLAAEKKAKEEQERLLAQEKAKGKRKPANAQSQSDKSKTSLTPEKTPVKKISPAKSSSKPLKGNFADNRGRLPSPVTGSYRIVKRFGRQKHPDLKYVETDNPGIDIETSKGANAVAVFDGHISDIFRLPGYNTIVMVRHGDYLTIYANLETISVKKGDSVKAGQVIGKVFSDPDDDGRSILHFEIRHEKAKENPEAWIA